MTQLVYMVILDFIESNQEQFAGFCGDDSIAWANHNEFKEWLEERDKSDAKILYELKAKNEQLEKEANWLAQELAKFCSRADCDKCEYVGQQWEENTFCKVLSLGVNSPDTWREAARKAVEAECKSN